MTNVVAGNQGSLLLGGLVAAVLSGMVAVQVLIYFKLYPRDPVVFKTLVLVVWIVDLAHSGLVFASIWEYVIRNFGNADEINIIPLPLSLTVVFTALLTYIVHCFFAHRIFLLSKRSWYLTIPIVFLATCRLCSASATSAEMIRLEEFPLFKAQYRWLFALGLALSSVVDILVTLCLFVLLQNNRSRSISLDQIIDDLILYAFEIGCLTCAGTVVSMVCWLAMNNNLIFMGLHFAISKLYANSLLASLNTRQELRRQQAHQPSRDGTWPLQPDSLRRRDILEPHATSDIQLQHVQINVEKTITYDDHRSSEF